MARTEIAARLDGTELMNDFKAARDKRQQVNILADLNCVAPRVIAELLHELGALEGTGLRVKEFSAHYVPVPPARDSTAKEPKHENTHQVGRPRKAWDLDLIRWCYDQGMSDESIAYEAGCSRGTVCSWRKRNGLPPVSKKNGRSGGHGKVQTARDGGSRDRARGRTRAKV